MIHTGSIFLSQIRDGADASSYFIESNQEEVLVFYEKEGGFSFSPSILEIKTTLQEKEVALKNNCSFQLVFSDNQQDNIDLLTKQDFFSFGKEIITNEYMETTDTEKKENKDYFEKVFYLPTDDTAFEENKIYYEKDENGNYIQTTDNVFNTEKIYYEFIENGTYLITEDQTFANEKIYYERKIKTEFENQLYFYIDKFFTLEDNKKLFAGEKTGINFYLRFAYKKNNIEENFKVFSFRYGTSQDMASFRIEANQITAAIQNSKLSFDASGLHIQNGGFDIKNSDGEEVFSADDDGNLMVTGTINANAGKFTGVINATEGKFSGMIEVGKENDNDQDYITIDGLNSQIRSSNFNSDNNEGFCLKSDGGIEANKISLGEAVLKKSLSVGENCVIQSPDNSDNRFIYVIDSKNNSLFSLDNTGDLILGEEKTGITLKGSSSTIESNNYSSSNGWSITPDKAIFNNITARGTLQTAVFEKGKVQTVGGMILVRPSAIIDQAYRKDEYNICIITNPTNPGFRAGDYCEIGEVQSGEKIYKITEIDEEKIYLSSKFGEIVNNSFKEYAEEKSELINELIVDYGQESNNILPVSIAINSSENNADYPPQAISICENEFKIQEQFEQTTDTTFEDSKIYYEISEDGQYIQTTDETFDEQKKYYEKQSTGSRKKNPRIILGQMNGSSLYGGLTGYGLYADNVYLKGALVSGNENATITSGIDTLSKIQMPSNIFSQDTVLGEIILWAGAGVGLEGNFELGEAIEKAPFKVDSRGNFYAGSGYFEGSIISKAIIEAAKIKTAVIEGANEDEIGPALKIIDVKKAIGFYSIEQVEGESRTEEKVKMLLSSNDLSLNIPIIGPQGNFKEMLTKDLQSENIQIGNYNIKKDNDGFLSFWNGTQLRMKIKDEVQIRTNLKCSDSIFYGEKMEYRPSQDGIGYDLYVKE